MPLIKKQKQKQRKVFISLNPKGARNCGHISIIIEREDGGYDKYNQGAVEPEDSAFKLILLKNPVQVHIKKYKSDYPLRKILKDTRFLKIPVKNPSKLEESIQNYINENRPYNSLSNNCMHFVLDSINLSTSFKLNSLIIPRLTFYLMEYQVNKQKMSLK